MSEKRPPATDIRSQIELTAAEIAPSRGMIRSLPKELRKELDRRLVNSGFRDYRGLARWLKEHGYAVSLSSLHRYGSKFEHRLDTIRLATAQAREIVALAPEEDAAIEQALMRLVQSSLFDLLVRIEATRTNKTKRREEAKVPSLTVIANTVAALGRASVMQRKWNEEMRLRLREKVSRVGATVSEVEREAGLSREAADKIRQALTEIKP